MKDDITKPSRGRGRPRRTDRYRMRIDFSTPEARALRAYKLNQGNGATYNTVLVDGLQLLPGFSVILKRETQRYESERSKEDQGRKDARRVEKEFN